MDYYISNKNIKIPAIIYGTAWKKEETSKYVQSALLSGFRGIDTAGQPKHYQEHLVGEGLLKAYESGLKREDIYLQTKFTPIDGQDINNMPYEKDSSLPNQIRQSFEKSKENLHTNYIDSYILHSPLFPSSKLKLAWSTMESFYENKEVGQLGISNCYDLSVLKYLYENSKVKPSLVQNRFYAQTDYDVGIRKWCKEKGIIYQGFWTLTANPEVVSSQIISNLADKYTKTNSQIFYRFLHHIDVIPLIGTTSKAHMADDIAIFEFELEEKEIKSLLELIIPINI